MGKEADTRIRVGSRSAPGRVLLESGEVIIRGDLARRCPFAALKEIAASKGVLRFKHEGVSVAIELGDGAEKWLKAIKNPRTRVQKLGVAPGMKVVVVGSAETDVIVEIEAATGSAPARRLSKGADLVLLFAQEVEDLDQLGEVEPRLAEKGAAWVLWPKGRKDFAHEDVVSAAKRAGLVQTRSMGFSEENTGLRLARPAKNGMRV